MVRYSDIMDKLIDNRVNYLLRKKTNKGRLEKLIDNKDISVDNLQSDEIWEFKHCKKNFILFNKHKIILQKRILFLNR